MKMILGFNTTGNSQTSGRTATAVSLGKLRNSLASTTRIFTYCNRTSPDIDATLKCVFNAQRQPIIMSGQYQIAVGNNAFAISRDYGINWELKPEFATLNLRSVAISSDGKYILTGGDQTPLFYSNDSGKTFTQKVAGPNYWFSITMSRSGQYQTAVGPLDLSGNGQIYVSNDYGNNFNIVVEPISGSYQSYLAMSYDGKYQSVTSESDTLFISNDYGQNWSPIVVNSGATIFGITMSGNGKIQYAVDENLLYLYKSTNYGNTWINVYTIPEPGTTLYFISTSETGQYVLIPNYFGSIWISNDYGNSFTNNININGQPQSLFGTNDWYPCGVSSSGQFQTVCDNSGYVYTSSDYGKNWYSRPSAGNKSWWGFFMNL